MVYNGTLRDRRFAWKGVAGMKSGGVAEVGLHETIVPTSDEGQAVTVRDEYRAELNVAINSIRTAVALAAKAQIPAYLLRQLVDMLTAAEVLRTQGEFDEQFTAVKAEQAAAVERAGAAPYSQFPPSHGVGIVGGGGSSY